MNEEASKHHNIRHYMQEVEVADIAGMGAADLIVGEAYTEAMIRLTDQLKDDADGWEATERQDADDLSMIPIETVNAQASAWQLYLKERHREMRGEIEARVKAGEKMPPWHVAGHTKMEPRKKE